MAIGNRMLRTLIFDMGNVLVRFSHERMCEQIGALCDRTGPEIKPCLIDTGLQWEFERGRCDEKAFHQRLEAATGRRISMNDLRHAASDIFEPNEEVVSIVRSLKRTGYRLVLLSNTSIAHYEFIRGRWDLLDPFDEFVLSYEVGAIKPEPAMFEAALTAIHCRPEEAFYTDDISAYVEAGRRHGLDAEVFTDAKSLLEQLKRRGVEAE
jgi:putative hydrolase of the HAD superfamily